jgi:hypothetical protein
MRSQPSLHNDCAGIFKGRANNLKFHMSIDLTKRIAPDSLRGLGSISLGLAPHLITAAGHRISGISSAMRGVAYKIGRVVPKNAFCVLANGAYYLYVRPSYRSYGTLFKRFFGTVPKGCDVDHVLAKALAAKVGIRYVLLAAVPDSCNRAHGTIEKIGLGPMHKIYLLKEFPLDERMFHKVLGRKPYSRMAKIKLRDGYHPGKSHDLGVTLKQAGLWNRALCVNVSAKGLPANVRLTQIWPVKSQFH